MEDFSSDLTFFINGKSIILSNNEIQPKMTLLQYLRNCIGLTGTKLGCGEGGCGACTVMLSSYDHITKEVYHYSANACLTPLCALDGIAVTTIEGIGSMKDGLHPIQKRISSMHGSQCGFCTPGIVMAIYAKLRSEPNATPQEIEESLDGNLCRCTGYRPIIDAARSLSNNKSKDEIEERLKQQYGCCMNKSDGTDGGCPCKQTMKTLKASDIEDETFSHNTSEFAISSKPSLKEELTSKFQTEPIFPPFLAHYQPKSLKFSNKSHPQITWYQPITINHLLNLKSKYPQSKLIIGNTEVGIEVKFKGMEYQTLINPVQIGQLQILRIDYNDKSPIGITVGAAVTINKFRLFIEKVEKELSHTNTSYLTRGLVAIKNMLTWFASNHIRNVASIGGNICTASPISDLNPMLMACSAILKLRSINGIRMVPIQKFFLSYRKVDLLPDEILENVFVRFTNEFEFVLPFKQARRREDDISIVTAGMRFSLIPMNNNTQSDSFWSIKDCSLAFGGLAATTIIAIQTSNVFINSTWNYETIRDAFLFLSKEVALPETVPGGQAEYRTSLAISFLFKAYLTITTDLSKYIKTLPNKFPNLPSIHPSDLSATQNFITQHKLSSRGEQGYFNREGKYLHKCHPLTTKDEASIEDQSFPPKVETMVKGEVGTSLMHRNAEAQVTGSTIYTDDIPLPSNALHACLVTSTRAHARILKIDYTEAMKCKGFVSYLSAKDVIGSNKIGAIEKDEEVFATEYVKHYGAVIAVILADTHEQAVYAARKVNIEYEDLQSIISIDDAIEYNSFYPTHHELSCGDLEKEKLCAEIHVEGQAKIGGQEHFYLETNCTIAIPTENGNLEVYSSTQNCAKTQNFCASVCGISASKVVAKCKRMGGGFGGKETRSVFIAVTAALGAIKLNRPVSINIERDVDMSITGQRHAFKFNYKAGMSKSGILNYLEVQLYSNGGFSLDLSQPVMDRALFHVDNVYRWPALKARGSVCRTNQPSHTAFRGFGGPQGLMVAETVMQHLSEISGLPLEKLKRNNIYQEGDKTHFGQILESFYVPSLWDKALVISDIDNRKANIVKFNNGNSWRKRGLAMVATKFGIAFTAKFMNQGGSLVHIYNDGSILVAIGGTEMGQGLFTKIIQITSQYFGVSEKYIVISETSTNTVANASPTAASMSTDLYGMAVLDACEQINKRLEPIRLKNPNLDWPSLINIAFFERIDLSAHGFHAVHTKRCGYDWEKPYNERGLAFNYFTMGVACTEVEIDCLTGDSQIIRADILMDVGKSINPAIDIGQIEGAFVQGYGWSTMEELVWGDKDHSWVRPGQLFTKGPGTYKIPSFNDVPLDFRVHLSDTCNKYAIHSSKAIGEPPFFLGASTFFAIKDAINAKRKENGYHDYYPLHLPATSERIRMACCDNITELCMISGSNYINKPYDFQSKGSY